MRILMVLTSHEILGSTGRKTGTWFEEFCLPYYAFLDAGADVTLASPEGGYAPVDPASEAGPSVFFARFKQDQQARTALADTLRLDQIHADDVTATFYPGGYGALWDLSDDAISAGLIAALEAARKPIALVCHGVAALLPKAAAHVVRNRRVTGPANSELAAAGLRSVVPFSIEDEIKKRGALYSKGLDGTAHVVRDDMLITGQNHASTESAARLLLEILIPQGA